jgi:hypothetical protein
MGGRFPASGRYPFCQIFQIGTPFSNLIFLSLFAKKFLPLTEAGRVPQRLHASTPLVVCCWQPGTPFEAAGVS